MEPKEVFSRLLHSQAHFDNWNAAHYNSYHYSVPGEWIYAYHKEGLRDPKDFSLFLYSGTHTAVARDNFLEIVGKYAPAALWSEADRGKVSQLDGVCAFRDMASIDHYAQGTPYGGMEVVEFEGIYVSDIPESKGGLKGVLVKPTKTISKKAYRAHSNS